MAIAQAVDYAFPPLPSAQGLAAAGKRAAGRYVGPGSGKFLTIPERDALFANGLDIFLLVEGEADSARGGRPVGRRHMSLAIAHAIALGAPVDNLAFYMAIDYDLMTSDWPTAREYLAGGCDVAGVRRVGVYGEHDAMVWAARDGVASYFFQTYAWSDANHDGVVTDKEWYAGNHVEQYQNGVQLAGGEVDLCRIMKAEFGQWKSSGPKGTKMHILVPGEAYPGQIFLADGTLYHELPGGIDGQTVRDVRYLAAQGAIALWKDSTTGSDVWNGGIGPAFGVDIATLIPGSAAALVPHVHVLSGETGDAVPTPAP